MPTTQTPKTAPGIKGRWHIPRRALPPHPGERGGWVRLWRWVEQARRSHKTKTDTPIKIR